MTYLLDTHTLIWFVEGNARLSQTARAIIADMSNVCFVSTVSLWEIAIKISSDKLTLSRPFGDLIVRQLQQDEIGVLPVLSNHLLAAASLPFPQHGHRDPFDRMLVCQALSEDLILISADSALDAYGVRRLW